MAEITTLICAGCQKPLVSFLKKRDVAVDHTVKASCPFCGDGSFPMKIHGVFGHSPIRAEESSYPTLIKEIRPVSDEETLFVIEKA